MKRNSIICKTKERDSFDDITNQIEVLVAHEKGSGLLHLFLPHTTAGLVISDKMKTVSYDIRYIFHGLFPKRDTNYIHRSPNSDAHTKSVVCGCELTIPVEDGKLLLGEWQRIFIVEGDGPKENRKIIWTYLQ